MLKKFFAKILAFFTIKEETSNNTTASKQKNTGIGIENDIFVDDEEDIFVEEEMSYKSDPIYQRKSLMSAVEYKFYQKLKPLETEYGYVIIPQLNLATVIDKPNAKYRSELFRNIDFAIFSNDYKDLLLLIELNDKTHEDYKQRLRDQKVRDLCEECDIEIMNFQTKYPNEQHYVINRILNKIQKEDIEVLNTDDIDEKKEIVEIL